MKAKLILAIVLSTAVVSLVIMFNGVALAEYTFKPNKPGGGLSTPGTTLGENQPGGGVSVAEFRCPPGWYRTEGSFEEGEITACAPKCPDDFKCPEGTVVEVGQNCCWVRCTPSHN